MQQLGVPDPLTTASTYQARCGQQQLSQFNAAERIAVKLGLTRETMEVYSLESNEHALRAFAERRFDREVLPYGALALW